ncbi:unnamed protein product [Moneuplotes crassus]|uniref:Uncharacterized protein n=1 Tax=Euplotes crassus TaxID=5936 RepID=A0AAD2D0H0_EUPCR|nr:unnamed protein product [Moneuplotes crassus]
MDYAQQDNSIEHPKELENVLDKVLGAPGGKEPQGSLHNYNEYNERKSITGSERRLSQRSQMSLRSSRASQAMEKNSRGSRRSIRSHVSGRSNASVGSRHSRKSQRSIQQSINSIRRANSRGSHNMVASKAPNKLAKTGGSNIEAAVKDVTKLRASINTKLNTIAQDSRYDKFFKNGALLCLPSVNQPVVTVVDPGRITFTAQNDAHSRESNFGYSRNKFGGFY